MNVERDSSMDDDAVTSCCYGMLREGNQHDHDCCNHILPPLPHALSVRLHTVTTQDVLGMTWSRPSTLADLEYLLEVMDVEDLERLRAWVSIAISRETAVSVL